MLTFDVDQLQLVMCAELSGGELTTATVAAAAGSMPEWMDVQAPWIHNVTTCHMHISYHRPM